MGLIGREIIQSRTYDDPLAKEPLLNYKEAFPITVFDAVRKDMNDKSSITLTEMLDKIFQELKEKQPIIGALPANYLMTYAGVPGGVGSIKITNEIPWDPTRQSHEKIPTEKAVGDLMFKLGLIDENGKPLNDPDSKHVAWTDVIGRPNVYLEPGDNDDGFMTQRATTKLFKDISLGLDDLFNASNQSIVQINDALTRHTSNLDNPHNVSIDQIGAASAEELKFHTEADNPHNITAESIGLDKVDNTSDEDKPLSAATREAIESINELIAVINGDVAALKYVVDIRYEQASGKLIIEFNNGDIINALIPIDGLVNDIKFDENSLSLVVIDLSGATKSLDLSVLFDDYLGSDTDTISIEIKETGDRKKTIYATLKERSIGYEHLREDVIDEKVIANNSVSTEKIKDNAVTKEKIANGSITADKMADRAVTPRTMFTAITNDKALVSYSAGSDPVWGTINGKMIDNESIGTRHIINESVGTDKLVNKSVITSKLAELSVTHEKMGLNSVGSENIINGSINEDKLVPNLRFPGIVSSTHRPEITANNNQLVDTHWVREFIDSYTIKATNIPKDERIVTGSNIFSSNERDKVLVVHKAGTDPYWGLISRPMMEDNIVDNSLIVNEAVTTEKIKPFNITSKLIAYKNVLSDHIADQAVTPDKLFRADGAGYVMGTVTTDGKPIYTKVDHTMIAPNSINNEAIQDNAVTMDKLYFPESVAHSVFGINTKSTKAQWTKISNPMLNDRIIDARTMFTSPTGNKVLVVDNPDTDPYWGLINSDMIKSFAIKREHVTPGIIDQEHILPYAIHTRHLQDYSVTTDKLAPRAVDGPHLFSSEDDNMVLAVTDAYSSPKYMKITKDMVTDDFFTHRDMEMIPTSIIPYRFIGVDTPNGQAKYLQVTNEFIKSQSITGSKLVSSPVFNGSPSLTSHPAEDSDDTHLASTYWVRRYTKGLQPGSITTEMIADKAVTSEKIKDSIRLNGSPTINSRPPADASDEMGNGDLIPDCQWVIDRINEFAESLEEVFVKSWGYGIDEKVNNNIFGNAANNTIFDASSESEYIIHPTTDSDYHKLEKAYDPSDKLVSNIHSKSYNASIPVTGGENKPIESTKAGVDLIQAQDSFIVSNNIINNIINKAFNASHSLDKEKDRTIISISNNDYRRLTEDTSQNRGEIFSLLDHIAALTQKVDELEAEIRKLKGD